MARSFALKEPPTKLAGNKKRKLAGSNDVGEDSGKHRASMAFDFSTAEKLGQGVSTVNTEQQQYASKGNKVGLSSSQNNKKILMANAAKLQSNGMDNF